MVNRIDLDAHVIAKPIFCSLEQWGRLDTPHRKGIDLYDRVNEAQNLLAQEFEAPQGYVFQPTPGGSVAMEKLLFHIYLHDVKHTGKNQFISFTTQDAAMLKGLGQMEQMGCHVKLTGVSQEGVIDLNQLAKSLGPKTNLVSFAAVCPVTGVMQPVEEIIELCRSKDVKVHVHATHAIGSWGVSLQEWEADYLSFDGDKLGLVSGIGGLFSKEAVFTEVYPQMVIDIASAIHQKVKYQEQFAMESARRRSVFEKEILHAFPDVKILGQNVLRAPHILAMHFPRVVDEALLYYLYKHHIDASIGGGPFQTVRAILEASGNVKEAELGGISMMFANDLLEDNLAYVLDILIKGVAHLRKLGGYTS